jgi:hypothetical protein
MVPIEGGTVRELVMAAMMGGLCDHGDEEEEGRGDQTQITSGLALINSFLSLCLLVENLSTQTQEGGRGEAVSYRQLL